MLFRSKMKAIDEPMFGTEAEASFFKGQGGVHAKNAEAWARANLSPEAVSYLDQQIATYQREKKRIDAFNKRQKKREKIRDETKTQVAEEAAAAREAGEYAPTLEEVEESKGTKTLAGKRKKNLQRLVKELGSDLYGSMDDIVDSDTTGLLADEDLAALQIVRAHV